MTAAVNAVDTSKTVLITGAAGDIGRAVVAAAAAAGYRIVAADQAPITASGIAASVVGDLRDASVVDAAFDAAEDGGHTVHAVLHLAAIPSPGQYDDHETLMRNAATAHRVLATAGERGVGRIVAVSSLSAVGFAWAGRDIRPDYLPLDEKHPIVAVDTYGLSKVFMEEIAAYVTRRWGVPSISLRFPFVGTGERLRQRLDDVAADPAGNSREMWSWLDTGDAARSVLLAAEADSPGALVLNIAAPDTASPLPTRELVEAAFPGITLPDDLPASGGLVSTRLAEEHLGLTDYAEWRVDAAGGR